MIAYGAVRYVCDGLIINNNVALTMPRDNAVCAAIHVLNSALINIRLAMSR